MKKQTQYLLKICEFASMYLSCAVIYSNNIPLKYKITNLYIKTAPAA